MWKVYFSSESLFQIILVAMEALELLYYIILALRFKDLVIFRCECHIFGLLMIVVQLIDISLCVIVYEINIQN
ncbi:Uncharacterised protein [Yersinia pseudotuberculosis]|nr:hypothetical protein EGX52_15040 [Yersinia pseudotuberculosis]PEI11872.1 hypothetical protein CRM78_00595 [Yersinia pseudotuberculosis]CNJ09647.1 Uncharacterised protein [Yersinia pseudotuberculosis]CNJ41681.1 Uncharacterised protein [Yersinia pseudotuberculosis]